MSSPERNHNQNVLSSEPVQGKKQVIRTTGLPDVVGARNRIFMRNAFKGGAMGVNRRKK